jgi:hypothetical protein
VIVIHVVCINQEGGTYLAYRADDPHVNAVSHNSSDAAVGLLMAKLPEVVTIINVGDLVMEGES